MKPYKIKRESVEALFAAEALKPEIDLGRAAFLIAKSEYPSLDVDAYVRRLDDIAKAISDRLQIAESGSDPKVIIDEINEYLFKELSFRGNVDNYYDPKN